MTGTILLTGANGSLGIPAVRYLLDAYPDFTLILTVRDDSGQDKNTSELRNTVARYPDASTSIRKLNLASLKDVKSFSNTLHSEIESGKVPRLVAIICNAMSWKLIGGPSYSADGYESSIAVIHLAHFALSLRLVSAMDAQRGRIVFLGSKAHWPLRAGLSKGFPTHIPDDLNLLVHPQPDAKEEEIGRGFQRYGTSKLVSTMVSYELNRRLKAVSSLSGVIYVDTEYSAEQGHAIDSHNHNRSARPH
jgi:NAD(P)-dependent dehydrogenase (short-subunit alcohol dehydrogenase family)